MDHRLIFRDEAAVLFRCLYPIGANLVAREKGHVFLENVVKQPWAALAYVGHIPQFAQNRRKVGIPFIERPLGVNTETIDL
jgi:hypothetical protein